MSDFKESGQTHRGPPFQTYLELNLRSINWLDIKGSTFMKRGILGLLLAAALCSSPAFAAQNVANTSQKGSLLIFPLIDVRTENAATTIVDISNDANTSVHLECSYINDEKGRVDFDFSLSPKGSLSWDVLTHSGELTPPPFPTSGTFPQGSTELGELICFAVDLASAHQVRFNHLTGTATVVYFDDAEASQSKQAFKYNAWAFTARSALAVPPPDGTPVGTAGDLVLSGGGDGTYDACPAYLIANFSPGGPGPANVLGGVTTLDNDLSISSCSQDLRQDFTVNLTKLQFSVWNSFEESFSGAYQCSDSVLTFGLDDPEDRIPVNFDLSNFQYSTLRTHNARVQIQGIASSQCTGSAPTGLVGVLSTSIVIGTNPAEDAEIGNTIHGAGAAAPGFVLWDPSPGIVPEKAHQR